MEAISTGTFFRLVTVEKVPCWYGGCRLPPPRRLSRDALRNMLRLLYGLAAILMRFKT